MKLEMNSKRLDCFELKIPEYLHTKERTEDQNFTNQELLFRRFSPDHYNPIHRSVSPASIRVGDTSVNREKYSKEPNDVLYNTRLPEHYFNYGIFEITVGFIRDVTFTHPEDSSKVFTLRVLHEPSRCMYPHSVIKVEVNGELLENFKRPNTVKTQIKVEIANNCNIVKIP